MNNNILNPNLPKINAILTLSPNLQNIRHIKIRPKKVVRRGNKKYLLCPYVSIFRLH